MQPLLQWKSINYYVSSSCVYKLVYPVCKAHAPYYVVICGLSGCTVFSTLSRKWHDFREKKALLNIKDVLIFTTIFVCNISHSNKN